jgi:uncharacterized protein
LVLTVNIFAARAAQYTFPAKPTHLVTDDANLLTPADLDRLEVKLRKYEQGTSIEIAVVTVPSMNGDSIEEYAVNLFAAWGIGKKGKDNGVLLLLAPNEKKMRIEVGYGLEPYLTDGAAGDIIREKITPIYRSGKIPESINGGVDAIIKDLGNQPYADRVAEQKAAAAKQVSSGADSSAGIIVSVAIGFGLFALALGAYFFFRKKPTEEVVQDDPSQELTPRGASYWRCAPGRRIQTDRPSEEESSAAYVPYVAPLISRSDSDDSVSSGGSSYSSPDPPSDFSFGGGDSGGGGASGDL